MVRRNILISQLKKNPTQKTNQQTTQPTHQTRLPSHSVSIHVIILIKKKNQKKPPHSCSYKPSHQATEKSFLGRSADLSHTVQCPIHSWDPKTHKTVFHE